MVGGDSCAVSQKLQHNRLKVPEVCSRGWGMGTRVCQALIISSEIECTTRIYRVFLAMLAALL